MRTSKDEYHSILNDAHYWTIVKDAVEIEEKSRTFEEAYAEYGDDWECFPYRYTLVVDLEKLSGAFFHPDHHVNIVIKK